LEASSQLQKNVIVVVGWIYHTILKLADHALFKMVRYVLLQPLRPELEIQLEQFKEASSKPAQL
jgi:hypothetical protein